MEALVLLSVWRKRIRGDVTPTVGEGIGDPQTERVRPRTARGGLSRDLRSPSPGSLVLCGASPLPPRPTPHLLRRLGVKVRLQQRDRELDLPGAVVLLHGWGGGPWAGAAAGGKAVGLGAGAGALPLRSAPAPAPARRAQLAAAGSALSARGPGDSAAADWLRTRPSRPPPPAPARSLNPIVAAPPAAGVTAPRAGGQASWCAPVPVVVKGTGGHPGLLQVPGRDWEEVGSS